MVGNVPIENRERRNNSPTIIALTQLKRDIEDGKKR